MTDTPKIQNNAAALRAEFTDAGAEIERVAREQIAPAAALIDEAFSEAASSIQSNLQRAARNGAISLKSLTAAIARDLKRFAIEAFIRKPLQSILTNAFSAPFGGARASGGPVAPGQSFLVGERGPELFTPAAAGAVSPLARGATIVNITLPGVRDPESFRQSETQIAAALARAVGRGQRNL